MAYDFKSLSPADFEDLTRDLIGRALQVRFEAFAAGPDGGIDGRHSRAKTKTILQAKHYANSSWSSLKAAMKRERTSIDKLAPNRYLLATSRPLTPKNKADLRRIAGPAVKNESDIWGAGDLNGLIRMHPEIEKAHIKLWLSSAAVLDKLLRSAAYTFNRMTRDDIEKKVRIYASNPSFAESRQILESRHVLIISGPPGVGKTTLAEMLAYAYLGEDWKLVAVRSLDDGFAAIDDSEKQIFLFDDFLGKIALDARALAAKDSDLARFIRRVRGSRNARFILTTRAYIFEEARRISEHLSDKSLDVTKYVLDVGIYTRRIRARILYNHLIVAGTPRRHVRALIESGKLSAIVDHENYNPRVIEWMTDSTHLSVVEPDRYAREFIAALNKPHRLWDTAFRAHIPEKCRHLLVTMFFCPEYGVEIEELRLAYDAMHAHFCKKFGHPRDPKDFDEAIRILEGGFLVISETKVSYVNPSFRDYMRSYLDDVGFIADLALTAQSVVWAGSVWEHGLSLKPSAQNRIKLAQSFRSIAAQFESLPTWKRSVSGGNSYTFADASISDRLSLLLEWWGASKDSFFVDRAIGTASVARGFRFDRGFEAWRDARKVIALLSSLSEESIYEDLPREGELLEELELGLCEMLTGGIALDDLDTISDAIDSAGEAVTPAVGEARNEAIREAVKNVRDAVEEVDSVSDLEGHVEILEKLASKAGLGAVELAKAVAVVKGRVDELNETVDEAEEPQFSGPSRAPDKFGDADLRSLFLPLLHDE